MCAEWKLYGFLNRFQRLVFLPISSWNNLQVRIIWSAWFVQMSSLSTISVWHNVAQMQKADIQTMTFLFLSAGCGLCVFLLCCLIMLDGLGHRAVCALDAATSAVRWKRKGREQDRAVVQSKCYKGWNNNRGRDPVSLRSGSFQSHIEVTAGRRLLLVWYGKYCNHAF